MKKVGWLCLALLIALGSLGLSYSVWSTNLTISGSLITATYPAVTTGTASSITDRTAALNGNLGSLGSASGVSVFFQYGLTAAYGSTTVAQAMNTTDNFTANLSSLSAGNTYHFRAVAEGGVTSYGSDQTFTTQSSVITLSPEMDSYIDSSFPNTNYSAVTGLSVAIHNGNTSTGYEKRSLLQFDLSSLSGKTIESAELRLYCIFTSNGNASVKPSVITSKWDENGVTWISRDSSSNWSSLGGDYSSLEASEIPVTGQWTVWDVKNDVQTFVNNPSQNYGWILLIANGTKDYTFNSGKALSNHPQLVITYH